jgi:DNA-binding transcriptional LysR family regulator
VYSGHADFGVTYADFLPASIDPLPLGDERLYAVVPREHRLAGSRKPLRFGQLKDEPTIALSRESLTRRLVDGTAAANGFGLSNIVVVPGFLEMIGLARAGVGIGVVPESVLALARSETAVRRIVDPDLAVSMVAITLRDRQLTPVAAGLRALLIERMRASHRVPTP